MKVIKRDGSSEPIKFDKISARIKKQTYGFNTDYVDYMEVTQKVIAGIFDGITTKELDNLAAEIAASLTRVHYDYSKLASRISISSLKKYTKKSFTETIEDLYHYVNPITGEQAGLIADNVYNIVRENSKKLEQMIVHDRDFDYDFFGFKTLERAYLLKINNEIAETPQHMCLRVSLGIWGDNLKEVQKTYDSLSKGLFTHATPTLFNSGTKKPQLSSCFLLAMADDSIKGIYESLSDCADISQSAGGIGIHIHNVRAKGTYIKGTNGTSNGIVPMLRVYNETARYVDQCFTEDTLVNTITGYKKISELNKKELIKTSDGFKEIKKIKKFENKERVLIKINNKTSVTPKHPFLVIKSNQSQGLIKKGLISGSLTPNWVNAEDLTSDMFILK
jgi:ribonucleoside-diphosphate reductase alpha chain